MTFKLNKIADIAFYGLCITFYISLNSITDIYFGIQNIASPLILVLSVVLLYCMGVRKSSFNYLEVLLFYGLFFLYYFIGFAVRLYRIEIEYDVPMSLQINNFLTSFITILCFHQYMFKRLYEEGKERVVFNAFYIPIIISTLFALYQSFTGIINLAGDEDGRFSSFYSNPNALGLVANIALVLNLYSLLKHDRFFVLKFILIPIILYVSFLSLSRTALFISGFTIVLFIFWLLLRAFSTRKKTIRKSIAVFGLPLYIIIYITLNFDFLVDKYLDSWQAKKIKGLIEIVFKGKVTSENTSSRTEHLALFYESFLEHPFLGKGVAYFANIPNHKWGVHNTYLLVLGDSGILPFVVLMSMILVIYYKSLWMNTTSSLITIGLMSVWCLQCMATHNGLDDKMYLIVLIFSVMYAQYGNSLKYRV